MGRAATQPDPDHYEQQYAHCDVLVIGGGITGLAAARAAAQSGARVILCDENPAWGAKDSRNADGHRRRAGPTTGSKRRSASCGPSGGVLLLRTTAFGYYDGNLVAAIERVADHLAAPPGACAAAALVEDPRAKRSARHRRDRARDRVREQRPARARCSRPPPAPTSNATPCDPARARSCSPTTTARMPMRLRCTRMAWRSRRSSMCGPTPDRAARCRRARGKPGLPIGSGAMVTGARGKRHVTAVDITAGAADATQRIDCDLVCVSGGWNPAVHLFSQARGKLRYDEQCATFRSRRLAAADPGGRCRQWLLRPWSGRPPTGTPRASPPAQRAGAAAPPLASTRAPSASRPPVDERADAASAAAAVDRAAGTQVRQALRRSAERRDGQRHRARRPRGLPGGRAPEALYDARHGHRPGQDQQRRRAGVDGAAARHPDSPRGHDHLPASVHAGDAGRLSRTRVRRARRTDALLRHARVARRARRALRQRRVVEAPAFVSAAAARPKTTR